MKFGIGQPAPRLEDSRLLRGRGNYTDDHIRENMVRACFLRSPYAHAQIISIDTAGAIDLPGVIAIYSGEDFEAAGLGNLPCLASGSEVLFRQNGLPIFTPPRKVIARETVRHLGEIIAIVIAETVDQAQDATENIFVEFEPLSATSDPREAILPDAEPIWPDCSDNVSFTFSAGDQKAVAVAFDTADHVVTFQWHNNRVAVTPMEPLSVLAEYDSGADKFTLTTGSQIPHGLRQYVAEHVLHMEKDRLRVISPDVGGAFGARLTTYPELIIALWSAKETGRPVKWTGDRSEAFVVDDNARDSYFTVALALDGSGNFQALRVSNLAAMGAYHSLYGPFPAFVNTGGLAGVYKTPLIYYEAKGVITNTASTGPYRGAGRPEMIFCIERAIDLAARQMGIDRFELRRRNMIEADRIPYQTGLSYIYDSGDFENLMNHALDQGAVSGFADRCQKSRNAGLLRGLGGTFAIEETAGNVEESVEIHINQDGRFKLAVGTHSHGQGHETTYLQVIGEKLKLDPKQIEFVQGDTDQVRLGQGTFGSRSIAVAGAAMVTAVAEIADKAQAIAADRLEVAVADIELTEGGFSVVGTDRHISWREAGAGLSARATIMPEGPTYPNGFHLCEVEIDPETGSLEIERYVVVDDVGTVINPSIVTGQIQGGVVQGIGQVIGEHVKFDSESAQLLTGSFMDYYMPRAGEMPDISVASHPTPTPLNPLGVKGVGEAGTVGALACVHSAVLDALSPLGIDWLDMPVTADRIWQAIKEAT